MRDRSRSIPRRRFLAGSGAALVFGATPQTNKAGDRLREFLRPYVVPKETIDRFLDPKARVWARFDPEVGYLLRNMFVRDGVDGSSTLARYEETGQRKQINFPVQPCRINTYGDSFTQGHQVSDGETWQELLAAHFCEPIRNFGIGGFGVYQAYRRLLRNEATDLGAPYLIFNIFGDDHYRSLFAWRWLSFSPETLGHWNGRMFHANPWVHVRLTDRGELIERPNLCPDEASLYRLCDLDFLEASFRDDEVVHLMFAERTGTVLRRDLIDRAATASGVAALDLSDPKAVKQSARSVMHAYALKAGMQVMAELDRFCRENGKKLLVLLSYPSESVRQACSRSQPGTSSVVDWHPRAFQSFLRERKVPFFDSLLKHVAEFDTFKLTPQQYVERYYIGHYSPAGNHFFAYAIKDDLLGWLDPKPPAYRNDGEPLIRFQRYLPG
jgi:hypothetical protein